jgi:hypothetical protein
MSTPALGWNENRRSHRQYSLVERLTYVLAFCILVGIFGVLGLQPAGAQDQEPIAAAGHGGFFDQDGHQIPLTLSFVAKAQAWYRNKLLSNLTPAKKLEFAAFEKRLLVGLKTNGQEKLVVQHQSLEWLLANTESVKLKLQTAGKLRALRYEMNWKLPEQGDLKIVDKREPFILRPEVIRRLESMAFKPVGNIRAHALSVTTNSGQAYIDECRAAGVPIPPSINVMDPAGIAGWKSQGFIPQTDQFIVGSPAEVRTYRTAPPFTATNPEGMCYSLPRYTDSSLSTFALDGVICMGKQSSKVCFWDNQWTNPVTSTVEAFEIPAGTQIPIGVPTTLGGKYQAGGKEIEFGPGQVCTDCHAGENPYITHPKSNLAPSGPVVLWESLWLTQNLPTMAINRYDPLVASSWPQNQSSQAGSTVPAPCSGCHFKGSAGRFPHLSNQIPSYCNIVLAQAITRTMPPPPSTPGSAAATANAFKDAWCNAPPDSTSEDLGDPHLTTVNGVHYDFQSAGEFVILRDDDGFQIQVRQGPIATTFNPGADPHDGLATCVSLNTAVAARVGTHRITYEPNLSGVPDPTGLQLRVDGVLTTLGGSGINLGDGGRIVSAPAPRGGGIEVDFPNGTVMYVLPNFWTEQGYWYMNVDVTRTPAVEGIVGVIRPGDWLPALANGTSLGPLPSGLHQRYIDLYQTFANAWRVTNATSLFDYAPGTSTATFTFPTWPLENPPCTLAGLKPATPAEPRLAEQVCKGIVDKNRRANCVFDVIVTGETGFADLYLATQKLVPSTTGTEGTGTGGTGTGGTGTGGTGTGGTGTTTPAGNVALFLDFGAGIPHGTFSNVFDTGFSFNAGLEYMFNPNFSAEGIFGYHRFGSKLPEATTNLNIYQFSANAKAYFVALPNKFRPFVNGGIGVYKFNPGSSRFGGNVGAGVLYEVTPKFGVQGSYNYHMINTPGTTTRFSTLQGGVRFVF